MTKFLQLALCNANGLTQLTEKLKTFISVQNIVVMLISGTHFTEKKLSKISHIYNTNLPAGTVLSGTAILIKNAIKHHQLKNYSQNFLKQLMCRWKTQLVSLAISAAYLKQRYTVKGVKIRTFLQYPRASVHCRRRLQCKAYRLGIQTHSTYRTLITQKDGKNQLEAPIYGRTHTLAIWQE
jgi:hypothetical protein